MKELAGDILIICGPAAFVQWAFGDPWLSGLWVVVGVTIQWYRRRWFRPPYNNGPHNDNDRDGDAA
jgi:hypothetical protein